MSSSSLGSRIIYDRVHSAARQREPRSEDLLWEADGLIRFVSNIWVFDLFKIKIAILLRFHCTGTLLASPPS